MVFKNWTYKDIKLKGEHFKALGVTEVYLSEGPYPWELVSKITPGGTHRLDISTSVWFYGTDPKSGLELRWSFDIEDRQANGKGYYEINQKECCRILGILPPIPKGQFREYLIDCAKSIEKNAKEYLDISKREFNTAKVLRSL